MKRETTTKQKKVPKLINPCDSKAMNDLDDNEVIVLTRQKNQECYQEIVKRYQKRLSAYLYHLVGNKEEVEDVLQEVFVKVYKNIKKFDVNQKFSSWIYRIAHNEAVNFLKKKTRRRLVSWEDIISYKDQMALQEEQGQESSMDVWMRKERRQEVKDAIAKLPKKYRAVLALRYECVHSYQEMAEILGKPTNTVGTLLRRAKKRLVTVLNEQDVL
ncbi:MAG: sigma-70 family RNA polymerase sigma factor [Candidatus Moranbacteria bacterium]|nr:sigma-70 family RNA polymerase sigma factor [Candidatus Moranbacteria bacterium]